MLDQATIAFLFPGQGSQEVGMGAELAKRYRIASQTFEEADDLLGFSLSRLCFEGPQETLTETSHAQPALYVAGVAALRTLYEELGESFKPAYVAGHSLGELTALTAAGSLTFPEGVKLVRRRGKLMRDAGQHSPGGMSALLGLNVVKAEEVCAEAQETTGGVVVVANDNCPGQIVIAGDEETLALATENASKAGAKRVVRLPVSIAAHTPLMAHAQEEFSKALKETHFQEPIIPIIGNTQAKPLTTAKEIRAELSAQLTTPVRWTESVRTMLDAGATTFFELGSKSVLIGLLKRIDRNAAGYVIDALEGLEALLADA